jgi:adenylate kinase
MRSDFGGEKEIKEYQEINRYYAVAYSAISGCHLAFVMGAYHKSEITAKKIEEVLR